MTTRPATTASAAIDGGSRGNPGEAGSGIVLALGDGRREDHTLYLGVATNNVAEYAALIAALERALALGVDTIDVQSDSELLVRQLRGIYTVRAPHLLPLWRHAASLARRFKRFGIRHVRRDRNAEADRLANVAIDTKVSTLPRPGVLP